MIPDVVKKLLTEAADKTIPVTVRANYRERLVELSSVVNKALSDFDKEYDEFFKNQAPKGKK